MADSHVDKRRRTNLTPEEKAMICNVYEGVCTRNEDLSTSDAVSLVSFLKKVSESTVYRCLRKKNDLDDSSSSVDDTRGRKKLEISSDTRYAIRRIVHSFFFKNELPNVKKISMAINADDSMPKISRRVLLRILKSMNFRYIKRNRKSMLLEKSEIISWRRSYLRKIQRYRKDGRKLYWMDETWLNEGHTVSKTWQDLSVTNSRQAFLEGWSSGLKVPSGKKHCLMIPNADNNMTLLPSGKGRRLIITHVGSDTGFLEGGLHLFQSKKTGDYHDEMNAKTFEEWFSSILPRLEPGSVIVMDNAPYHSRRLEQQPTSVWRKGQIMEWLHSKQIQFDDHMLKVKLLNIARQHKSQHVKYVIDEMARSHNVEVLRLPPYHCELNPIELIWAQIKGEVARNNITFKLADVEVLLHQAIQNVTTDNWQRCIGHVVKLEERMWDLDTRADIIVEPLIIQLGNSDDESVNEILWSELSGSDSE